MGSADGLCLPLLARAVPGMSGRLGSSLEETAGTRWGEPPQALARLLVEIPVIAGGGVRSGVHRAALLSLFDEILQQVLSTAPGSEVHSGRVKMLFPCKGAGDNRSRMGVERLLLPTPVH